jgi:hypothetical protein
MKFLVTQWNIKNINSTGQVDSNIEIVNFIEGLKETVTIYKAQ